VQTTYIITFIGDDRPGLVEALSGTISDHGGNWVESRLSQLSGKFAGLISVTLPEDSGAELRAALKGLHDAGISVKVTPCSQPASVGEHARIITLTILGPDRPGIVRETAAALSHRAINVVDMETYVSPAPMSAELLFHAKVEAELPDGANLEELSDKLDAIANEMDVDIHMEAD